MMGTFPLCNGVRHQRPHAKEIVLCVCLYDFISSIFRHKLNYVSANRYQTNVFYLFLNNKYIIAIYNNNKTKIICKYFFISNFLTFKYLFAQHFGRDGKPYNCKTNGCGFFCLAGQNLFTVYSCMLLVK